MRFIPTGRRVVRSAAVLAAVLTTNGCNTDILNVKTPNILAEAGLLTPQGVTTLRNGSLMDFIVAFSGTQDGYLVASGNMADEIQTVDTFADRYATDGRNSVETLGGAIDAAYLNHHRARAGMASAIEKWKLVKPGNAATNDTLAEMYVVRAYSELLFGEGYCSGVPFSKVLDNGTFEYGQPLTTTQMFASASASLDTALSLATGTNPRNFAAIAKGRVLVDLGQYAQAAAAVASVPTSFKYVLSHSLATTRQNNGVVTATGVQSSRYNIVTKEGINGLDFIQTPADPRMPWVPSTRQGFDGRSSNLPTQMKYASLTAPVTLADGIEARLIEAEAKLGGGSSSTQESRDAMLAILNSLRATGLPTAIAPLSAPTTHAAAVDMLFQERAYWLWLTGHRLGDLRRLIAQYGRGAESVFPTGAVANRPGFNYGTRTSLVVPIRERNNPNFKGCQD